MGEGMLLADIRYLEREGNPYVLWNATHSMAMTVIRNGDDVFKATLSG